MKINMNQTAFVRIAYPDGMWIGFGEKLERNIVSFD